METFVSYVLNPLLRRDEATSITVFCDATFSRPEEIQQWYEALWKESLEGKCNVQIRMRKRLSTKTQKMGIVQSMKHAKSEQFDFTIVTRNNMIWKHEIPFLTPDRTGDIGFLSFNTSDFGATRSGRRASRGLWHDYVRVEDKYIIVPRARLDEFLAWLTTHSDNVDVTQGVHDISSPIVGLQDLTIAWPIKLSSNTSLMDNPLYTLVGRPTGSPSNQTLLPSPTWQVVQ